MRSSVRLLLSSVKFLSDQTAMQESIEQYMQTVGQQARQASRILARASTETKNNALSAIYTALVNSEPTILAANQADMNKAHSNNLDSALLDRLELSPARFKGMLQGLKDVIGLKDPVGEITDMAYRPSGIQLGKMRVPLGVVGMIYESRPNVTLEAASLALKSGNAIILRGGSEALESNKAIAEAIQRGLKLAGLPEHAVQVINTADRAAVGQLITLTEFVDVIGWRLDDVVDLIKGPKGSTVRLQVVGANDIGTSQAQVISIVRDKIRLEDRAAKAEVFQPQLSELDQKIGVISIPGFYNNLAEDVKKLLVELKDSKVDGIIVDLRGNGGGSLQEATLLTGLFIDRGPVVQIREGDGKVSVSQDNDGVSYYDGPLTVMVDRYSASASEIFAAAMQDYGRALIVGEQTFGKGTVQQHRGLGRIYDMFDNPLGSVQYTIAKFYRINGGSTQHKGVIPDIQFPTAIDPAEWGESKEEYALPWDSINAARYNSLTDITTLVPVLREKHHARISSEQEFQYLLVLMQMQLIHLLLKRKNLAQIV